MKKMMSLKVLASHLAVSVRSLHRWLTNRPEIHKAFRAKKIGKHWKILCPSKAAAYQRWLVNVKRVAKDEKQVQHKAGTFTRSTLKALGFSARLDHETRILGAACTLKFLSRLRTRRVEAHDGESQQEQMIRQIDGEPDDDELKTPDGIASWEKRVEAVAAQARIIAADKRCRIADVHRYWSGLSDYDLWPSSEHFKKAGEDLHRQWLKESLADAIKELQKASPGKPITAPRLAGVLFRTPEIEAAWKQAKVIDEKQKLGRKFLPPRQQPTRGISLRTFRSRYGKEVWKDAVTRVTASDVAENAIAQKETQRARQPNRKKHVTEDLKFHSGAVTER